MKTVIKLASGGVAIMTLVNDADEAEAIEKWKLANGCVVNYDCAACNRRACSVKDKKWQ